MTGYHTEPTGPHEGLTSSASNHPGSESDEVVTQEIIQSDLLRHDDDDDYEGLESLRASSPFEFGASTAWALSTTEGANLHRWAEFVRVSGLTSTTPIYKRVPTEQMPATTFEDLLPTIQRQLHGCLIFTNGRILWPRSPGVDKPNPPPLKGWKREPPRLHLRLAPTNVTLNDNRAMKAVKKDGSGIEIAVDVNICTETDADLATFVDLAVDWYSRIPVKAWQVTWAQHRMMLEFVASRTLSSREGQSALKREVVINLADRDRYLSIEIAILDSVIYGFIPEPARTKLRSGKIAKPTRLLITVLPHDVRGDIDIPNPDPRVFFTGTAEKEIRSGTRIKGCSVSQQDQALAFAKHFGSQLALMYGSKEQLRFAAQALREPFMEHTRRTRFDPISSYYGGEALFTEVKLIDPPSVVPSEALDEDFPGIPIIHVTSKLAMQKVKGRIIDQWLLAKNIKEAWLSGCELADLILRHGAEVLAKDCRCERRHSCDICLQLIVCDELFGVEGSRLRVCSRCHDDLESRALYEQHTEVPSDDRPKPAPSAFVQKGPRDSSILRGSVVNNAVILVRKECRKADITGEDLKQEEQAVAAAIVNLRVATHKVAQGFDIEWQDDFTRGPSIRPSTHFGPAEPLTMSVAARFPIFNHNGRGRIHAAPNLRVAPLYINNIQWVHPMDSSIRLFWEFDRMRVTGDYSRKPELINRLEHLAVIQAQVPHETRHRVQTHFEPKEWKQLEQQMVTGIANQEVCEKRVRNPWILKWTHAKEGMPDFSSLEVEELPGFESVQACLRDIRADPLFRAEYLPEYQGVPYPFEVGPVPEDWSWHLFYAFIAARLEVMITECDRHWITTTSVPSLIVIICWQVVLRKQGNCRPEWEEFFNLPLSPYSKTSFSITFGKIRHGQAMKSGLSGDEQNFNGLRAFDQDKCNIIAEAFGSDLAKSNWDDLRDVMRKHWRDLPIGQSRFLPVELPSLPDWRPINFKGSATAPQLHLNGPEDLDTGFQSDDDAIAEELITLMSAAAAEELAGEQPEDGQHLPEDALQKPKGAASAPSTGITKELIGASSGIQRCNMQNARNSCYLSSTIQLLGLLKPIKTVILGSFVGKESYNKQFTPANLKSIETMKPSLPRLLAALNSDASDGPLPKQLTIDFHNAVYNIKSSINPSGQEYSPGSFADANEFAMDLLDWLVAASNKAPPVPSDTLTIIQEETKRHCIDGTPLPPLKDQIPRYRNAFANEGNHSPLLDAFFIAIIREKICATCNAIDRSCTFEASMNLRIPEQYEPGTTKLKTYKLEDLVASFAAPITPAVRLECGSEDKTHAGSTVLHQRLVLLPEYLLVRLERFEIAVNERGGVDRRTLRNFVSTPATLSLSALSQQDLPSDRGESSSGYPAQNGEYRLIGINMYLADKLHYISFPKIGPEQEGPWIRVDDKERQPSLWDLQSLQAMDPNNYLPCLWIYRRVEQSGEELPPAEIASNFPEEDAAAKAQEKSAIAEAPGKKAGTKTQAKASTKKISKKAPVPKTQTETASADVPAGKAAAKAQAEVSDRPRVHDRPETPDTIKKPERKRTRLRNTFSIAELSKLGHRMSGILPKRKSTPTLSASEEAVGSTGDTVMTDVSDEPAAFEERSTIQQATKPAQSKKSKPSSSKDTAQEAAEGDDMRSIMLRMDAKIDARLSAMQSDMTRLDRRQQVIQNDQASLRETMYRLLTAQGAEQSKLLHDAMKRLQSMELRLELVERESRQSRHSNVTTTRAWESIRLEFREAMGFQNRPTERLRSSEGEETQGDTSEYEGESPGDQGSSEDVE